MNKRNELAQKAHANAVAKGFYNEKLSNEHYLMLIISEVAELVEADRKGLYAKVEPFERMYDNEYDFPFPTMCNHITTNAAFAQHIKNTKEDEFADIAIRLYDLAGYLGVYLNAYEDPMLDKPLSEFSFSENAYAITSLLAANSKLDVGFIIKVGLNYIEHWAKHENINLDFFITHKMRYNESREALHGKKY